MNSKYVLAAIAAMIFATIGSAYEAKSLRNAALPVVGTKVSLAAAVATAEHRMGGKALSAEYDRHKGRWDVDVEEVGDKRVMDVGIDATSGVVIAVGEDPAECDDGSNSADG
jgi:uncharacterized membrane protein YkoI